MPVLRLLPTALAAALAGCATTPAPDSQATLQQAEAALGSAQLKTLRFTAVGTGSSFGQAWQPGTAWPGLSYTTLTRLVDFENGAMREEFARSRSEPNGGGAIPLLGQGEARGVAFARERFAWNAGAAPTTPAAAAPAVMQARIHDLWTTTPQGAIKAARQYGATAGTRSVDGQTLTTLSYTVPGMLAATLLLDSAGLVTAIESRMPHPVLGDTAVVTRFSNYADVAGVKFPLRIRQTQGGFDVLDVEVKEVRTNTAADISVPDNVRNGRENVVADKVADGVWFLAGGSHNSVAVEMADHIVLVESPLYDGRAAAVFDTANQLVPGKTVRTVVNSHHHFDHAGGLRYAVGQGATLVTSAMAKPYFERTFANPNRIAPDRMAASGKAPVIVGVSGKHVISDSLRSVEVHEITGSVHAQGFMMVYLPREKLLIQGDAYTPGPPNSPPPPVPNANQVNLAQNIERLQLNVDRILPLHSRMVPVAELYTQIGRTKP